MNFFSTQPYKGTRDFFPELKRRHNWMFEKVKKVLNGFAYREYDGPMLEPFELYAAKTGEEIVAQQLYSLIDRGERKMAIRPEMTPTFARMVASRLQEEPKPIRWFSIPNLWRYERPQRGRLREHWQLNVDVVGGNPTLADAELLMIAIQIFKAFGGEKFLQIRVNSRRLIDFLFRDKMQLSDDLSLKVSKIVDAKNKMSAEDYRIKLQEIGLQVDQISVMEKFFASDFSTIVKDYGEEDAIKELGALFGVLKELGIPDNVVVFDPSIMRGLDYYTGIVFEAFDISPDNNRALFGGGRYDNLLGLFSKNVVSGAGFGLGDVTLLNFLETHGLLEDLSAEHDVAFACVGKEAWLASQELADDLRKQGLSVFLPLDFDVSLKAQFKGISKMGIPKAIVVAENELKSGLWTLKDMESSKQSEMSKTDISKVLLKDRVVTT